jgi:hypothetical protein
MPSKGIPERLSREIVREIERFALVQKQVVEIERERDLAATPCAATERKRHQLLRLKGTVESDPDCRLVYAGGQVFMVDAGVSIDLDALAIETAAAHHRSPPAPLRGRVGYCSLRVIRSPLG